MAKASADLQPDVVRYIAHYTGPTQHTRLISPSDQIYVGVPKEDAERTGVLVWDAAHGHNLDVSHVHPSLLEWLKNSISFSVSETVLQRTDPQPDMPATSGSDQIVG